MLSSDSNGHFRGSASLQPRVRMATKEKPLFDANSKALSQLQKYYASLESRIGYRLMLGGTRHLGYYPPGTLWPFPINAALRRMEDHLFDCLALPSGAKVLDAGCGVGHVAMHMARKGLEVQGIDITPKHLQWARKNINTSGLGEQVHLRLMDYHDLSAFSDASFDGVYTVETLVHAHNAEQVLSEFFRVLKPRGSLALCEYEHADFDRASEGPSRDRQAKKLIDGIIQVNKAGSMPSNQRFTYGVLQQLLGNAGFQDIEVQDISENVKPLVRLFYILAYIPWIIVCFLGLQAYFVNTHAGVLAYPVITKRLQKIVCVTARKPARGRNNERPQEGRIG